MRLYLDDERNPRGEGFAVVRSVLEARQLCDRRAPSFVSFDHDLGDGQPTGMDFAHWLVERDMDAEGSFLPRDFAFNVHSANPVGAANISGLLNGYLAARDPSPRR